MTITYSEIVLLLFCSKLFFIVHVTTSFLTKHVNNYTGCRKINVFQVGGLVGKTLRNLEKIK
jgi:hypothetical protein